MVHRYFSDEQLWDYLRGLSVSVLPYHFGTHSGWLEACHDLGTPVIAPSCGYYHQQQQCGVYDFTETSFDAASLSVALKEAYAGTAPAVSWVQRRSQRLAQREWLADRHSALYRRCLDA